MACPLPCHKQHRDKQHPMGHGLVEYFLQAIRWTQLLYLNPVPEMTFLTRLHVCSCSRVLRHKISKGTYFLSRDRYHPDQKSCISLPCYTIYLRLHQISFSLFSIIPYWSRSNWSFGFDVFFMDFVCPPRRTESLLTTMEV